MTSSVRLAIASALAFFAFSNSAHAQYIWNPTESGIWNLATNWTGGLPVSSATTTLSFGGTSTYSALDDFNGAFTLNQLNFNGTAANTQLTINLIGTTPSLVFGGTTPQLNIAATSNSNVLITGATTLSSNFAINNGGSGILYYTGAFTANGNTISFDNTGGSGNSFLTGAITFTGGSQAISMSGTGTGNTTITGAITFANSVNSSITNSSASGLLTVAAVAKGTTSTLTLNANGGNILGVGVISGSGPTGAGQTAVDVIGSGTVVLTAANTFTAGTQGTGSAIRIGSGSTLGFTGDTALGAAPGAANTQNSTVVNGGTLRALTTVALSANRGIGLQDATNNTISVAPNQLLTVPVVMNSVSGSTPLTIDGGGVMLQSATAVGMAPFTTGASGITIRGGSTLRLASDFGLGNVANPVFVGDASTAGTLMVTTATAITAGRGITIGAGGGTLNATGVAMTYAGAISGTGPLTYAGGNTFTFTPGVAVAPYAPTDVTITGGSTVNHVMTNATSGVYDDDIVVKFGGGTGAFSVGATGAFVGGGTLGLTGGGSASTQTLSGIQVNNGLARIVLANGTGGLTLNFLAGSSITRAPGTVLNFTIPASTSVDVTNVTSGVSLTNGILGGNVTVGTGANPTDFATVDGSNLIIALPVVSYTTVAAGDVAAAWVAGNNVRINSTTISNTPGLDASTNSLKFDTGIIAGTTTLTLNGTNHLSSGGLLVSSALATVGTLIISDGGNAANRLSAGNDSGSPTAADLTVTVANTAGQQPLRMDAGIVDNGSGGSVSLVKTGQGLLILNAPAGTNTYSGSTTVTNGTLRLGAANSLPSSTALSLGIGSTLEANNLNVTVGSLAGAGNVNLGAAAGGRLIINGSASTIYSGVISGNQLTDVGLELSGSGTTKLLGVNTFARTAATQGTGSVVRINSGATAEIFVDTGLGAAPGSVIAGRNYLNLNGGTLKVNSLTTYSVNRGIILTGNSTIAAADNSSVTINPVINVQGNTLNYTAGSDARLTASGTLFFSGPSNAITATPTSSLGIGSITSTSVLNWTGAASFTAGGSGYVTFSGAQLLSGPLTITNNNTTSNTILNTNAALTLSGAITAGGNSITINNNNAANTTLSGAITFTTPVSITNQGSGTGAAILSGAVTLSGPAALTATNNASSTLTLSGALAAGIGSLTVGGTGSTLYTGAITFTGPSSITIPASTGNVQFGNITFAANGSSTFTNNSSNPVSINGTTTTAATRLTFTGSGDTNVAGPVTTTAAGQVILAGSGDLNLVGTTTLTSMTLTNDGAGGAINFNGRIASAGITLNTTGSGPINFTGAYTTTAAVNLVNTSSSLNFSGPITLGGAFTVHNNSATSLNISSNFTGASGITLGGAGNTTLSGNLGATVTTLSVGGTQSISPGLVINGVAPGGVPTFTLTGTNAYTGATTLTSGKLEFTAANNLGTATGLTALALNGGILSLTAPASSGTIVPGTGASPGATVGASVALNVVNTGNTMSIPGGLNIGNGLIVTATGAGNVSIAGNATNTNASSVYLNLGTGTLSLNNLTNSHTAASTVNLGGSGNITVGGVISNGAQTTALTLVGLTTGTTGLFTPGTVTVGNANTYTGATTINSGTVAFTSGGSVGVNGPLGNNSAITLGSGVISATPAGATSSTPLGNLSYSGGAGITINNANTGGTNVTTLSFGTLTRSGQGTLVVNSGTAGILGTDTRVAFSTSPTLANTIVSASIVGQLNGSGNTDADFLTYTGVGSAGTLEIATYTGALPSSGGANTEIRNSPGISLTGATLAYALQVNGGGSVDLNGSSLTIGNNTGQAGLILNSASTISNTGALSNLAFSAAEAVVYVNGASSFGTNVNVTGSAGLTLFGPGSLSLQGATNGLTGGNLIVQRGATLTLGTTFALGARQLTLAGGTLNVAASTTVTTGSGAINAGIGGGVINTGAGSTLNIANLFAFAANPITILGSGDVNFNHSVTSTVAGSPGLIIGTSASVYSGTVTINTASATAATSLAATLNSGTLQLQARSDGSPRIALNSLTVNSGLVRFLSSGPANSTAAGANGQVGNAVILNGGTLDVNGFSSVIGGLSGGTGLPGSGGTITNSASGLPAATLVINLINGNNTNFTIFGGTISDTAVDSTGGNGTLNLVIGSNGASANGRPLVLTGNNTFHGTITLGTTVSPSNNGNSLLIGSNNALQNATLVNNLLTTPTTGVAFATGPLVATNGSSSSFAVTAPVIGGITGYGNLVLPGQPIDVRVGNNNLSTTYSGVIQGGQVSVATLTKIGSGTLTLTNVNTFAGIAAVSSGTLTTAVPNALFGAGTANPIFIPGTAAANLAGNTLNPTGSGVLDLYSLDQAALSIQGNGTISMGNYNENVLRITGTVSNTFAGGITGSGGITKTNTNFQILTGVGTNTWSGPTTLIGGTLQASFTNLAGTNSNVFSPNSTVVFASTNGTVANGVLNITASNVSGSTSNQTIAGLTLNPNVVGKLTLANPVFDATLNVTLPSTITRGAGSVLNIITPSIGTVLTSTSAAPITSIQQLGGGTINILTSAGTANQILTDGAGTAYATFPTDWAVKNAGNTALLPASQVPGFTYTGNAISAGSNTLMTAAFTAPATDTAFNSLHIANVAAGTITMTANNYTINTGGILQSTAAVAAGTIGNTAGTGNLLSGTGEFVITSYLQALTINANLTGSGTAVTTNMVAGTLTLAGANTFSGPLNISAGAVTVTGTISNVSAINSYGGLLTLNKTTAGGYTISGPITGTAALTNTSTQPIELTGTINLTALLTNNHASATLTIGTSGSGSNTLIGTGGITNTLGTLILNTPNTFTGATTITAGATSTVRIMHSLSLQNSSVAIAQPNGLQFGDAGSGLSAATIGIMSGAGALSLTNPDGGAVALTINNNNAAAASYTGLLSGLGSIVKVGTTVQTFAPPANTGSSYTGNTTVANSGLTLTFAAAGSTASVLYHGVAPGTLIMGGTAVSPINASTISTQGTLLITSSTSAGTNTQNFGGLELAANSNNTMTLTTVAGVTLNTGLGSTLTRNTGSFLNIAPAAAGTNNITASFGTADTILTSTGGIVVGQITSNDWLAKNGANTNIVGLSTVAGGYGATNASVAGTNWNFTATSTATSNTANSIRANAGTVVVTLLAASTTDITTGGVMEGSGAAGSLSIVGAAGTALTSTNDELVFLTNRASQLIVGAVATPLGAQIVNDSGNPLAVTSAGISTNGLLIRSFPTYTGQTTALTNIQVEFAGTWNTSAIYNNAILLFAQAAATVSGDGGAAGTITFNNVISGTGALTQSGTGTTILGGANTYTGTTTVSNGVLRLANANALPSTTLLQMNAGASVPVLDLNGNNSTVGALSGNVAAALTSASYPIIRNGLAATTSILTVGTLNTNTQFVGSIQNGTGTVGLTKVGTGELVLTGLNTYTGTTTVNAGALSVAASGALGTGPVVMSNTNTGAGTGVILSIANTAQTIGSLSTGTISVPSSGTNYVQLSIGPNNTLTVNQTTAGIFAGNVTGATGALVLGASSTNSLSLTAPNYYGGGTTINGGTLLANNATGSATGTGSVTVNAGGILGGGNLAGTTGFISGAVTISVGGILAPGNSPGELTVGNVLTMNAGAQYNWEVANGLVPTPSAINGGSDTGNQDILNITGSGNTFISSGTIGTPNVLTLSQFGGGSVTLVDGQTYSFTIVSLGAGTISPTLGTFTIDTSLAPDFATYAVNNGGDGALFLVSDLSGVYLNLAPVPEPSTIGLIAAMGLGLGRLFRRRGSKASR